MLEIQESRLASKESQGKSLKVYEQILKYNEKQRASIETIRISMKKFQKE